MQSDEPTKAGKPRLKLYAVAWLVMQPNGQFQLRAATSANVDTAEAARDVETQLRQDYAHLTEGGGFIRVEVAEIENSRMKWILEQE